MCVFLIESVWNVVNSKEMHVCSDIGAEHHF
jgi:hypothetical protein